MRPEVRQRRRMNSLLVINSSGRTTRSITRHLTARFTAGWRVRHPEGEVVVRDVGLQSPPAVDETWIAAANPASVVSHHPLAISETLIEEISRAAVIILGSPIYNFGMPAQLKAYFDQVVRIGRTFAFDASAADPYRPLLASKPVFAMVSVGDGSLLPGGALEHLNFLEPHLATILGFVGLTDVTFIRAGYEEYQDDRAKRSLAAAEAAVDEAMDRLGALTAS